MKTNLLLLLGLAVAASALAACSNVQQVKVPEKVLVPTPVACVDPAKRPKPPRERSESDLIAMERYRRTLATWSELQKSRAYALELEAIVEGCSRIR